MTTVTMQSVKLIPVRKPQQSITEFLSLLHTVHEYDCSETLKQVKILLRFSTQIIPQLER